MVRMLHNFSKILLLLVIVVTSNEEGLTAIVMDVY